MALGWMDQGLPVVREGFDRLETLFPAEPRTDKDFSLCFLCLRWTTGDEDCRRGYPCDLEAAADVRGAS
jgi:hypothetical protein